MTDGPHFCPAVAENLKNTYAGRGNYVARDNKNRWEGGVMASITTLIGSAVVAALAWFTVNFLGKPILAIREKRLEALKVGERYSHINNGSSDELRDRALKSLHDIGNDLQVYSRERSIATSLWCWIFHYDLEFASRCLFGIAEFARGQYSFSEETRKNTVNALYVSLDATQHLSLQEIKTMNQMIAEAKGNLPK